MIATALQVSGAVCITTGAAVLLPPLGFIVGGVFLLLFGIAATKD